jgi:hypothetical protein
MKDSLGDHRQYHADKFLENPPPEVRKQIRSYLSLSTKEQPSEEDADRLAAILSKAETDDVLALWIVVADSLVSRRLGLLSPENYAGYEKQHELLITCLSEYSDSDDGLYEGQEELLVACASGSSTNSSHSIYPAKIEQMLRDVQRGSYEKSPE